MREIKFRGKSIDEWVYGFLLRTNKFDLEHGEDIKYSIQTDNREQGEYEKYFITNDDTIGQYTGLKDKNGTEIYEGDIFEVINSHEERFIVWVEYSEKYAEFVIRHSSNIVVDNEPLGDVNTSETVVILGNIHDNPELISWGG